MRGWHDVRLRLERSHTSAWAAALALSGSTFCATVRLAVHSTAAPLTAYLVAFACVVACVLLVAVNTPTKPRTCVAGCLVASALLILAQRIDAAGEVARAVCVLISLLLLGCGVGMLVGVRIKEPGHVLFVAIVSGVADTWSVTQPGGISKALAEEPAALSLLALPWPLLGTHDIAPLLGIGDIVFTALYVGATRVHALPLRRTLLALVLAYLAAALCVVRFERPIPVLPWLGLWFVILQPRVRNVEADDLRRGAWVLTVLAGVLAAWLWRRSL
jgi:hypothetical protein